MESRTFELILSSQWGLPTTWRRGVDLRMVEFVTFASCSSHSFVITYEIPETESEDIEDLTENSYAKYGSICQGTSLHHDQSILRTGLDVGMKSPQQLESMCLPNQDDPILPRGWSSTKEGCGKDLQGVTNVVHTSYYQAAICDSASYASSLTPTPQEWLVEKDWYINHHWEDQFCRDVYQDLRRHPVMQHLPAAAMISPSTALQICPVDSIVNTHPVRGTVDQMTLELLDPCIWKHVLTQEELATFRLNSRSDVISTWQVDTTAYAFGSHYQVKITVTGCGLKKALSKSKRTYLGLQPNEGSHVVNQTRILLLHQETVKLSTKAYYHLKKQNLQPSGAAKAYRKSQSSIFSTQAPQFVGAGEGTNNLDFMADLSALEVINPDAVEEDETRQDTGPIPESPSELLSLLTRETIPYAHCAWCTEQCRTMSQLESHYFACHPGVLQPSCCSPPSVFQTIMGMELQLRQANFGSFSRDQCH